MESAHCLNHGLEYVCPVLGEQVPVDVLGRLDLAMPHLMRNLHVRRTGGDEQGGTYVPQLVGGVSHDAVLVGRSKTLREFEVLPPCRVAKEATSVSVDQAAVQPALAVSTARCAARRTR